MSGKLSYFGLILLLIGVVCLVFSEVNLAKVNPVEVGSQELMWSFACNLTEGRTYMVYIESNDDWGVPFARGDINKPQPVNVTVTSPGGGVTRLQAFYYGEATTSPYYREGTPPTIVEVRYQSVDDTSLRVDLSSSQIIFTAKQSGPYRVLVLQEGLWSKAPPNFITFYEELAPNREIYSLLALGSGIVGTLGGAVFIVSLLGRRSVKHKRTR